MSKTLDYIADLERENRLLKSFLYCTKRSCNNCGKVNCENFQRQRIDCCGLWVSYKDYIKQQEGQIADIKANCDLAIEGRDVKIKELELELTVEKDQHQEEINLHLHAEDYIKELEQQIEKMKNCGNCKYGYCGGSSISIDKDGNRTFHNWNEEKQAYCDIGKNGKYQCWEIKEND